MRYHHFFASLTDTDISPAKFWSRNLPREHDKRFRQTGTRPIGYRHQSSPVRTRLAMSYCQDFRLFLTSNAAAVITNELTVGKFFDFTPLQHNACNGGIMSCFVRLRVPNSLRKNRPKLILMKFTGGSLITTMKILFGQNWTRDKGAG